LTVGSSHQLQVPLWVARTAQSAVGRANHWGATRRVETRPRRRSSLRQFVSWARSLSVTSGVGFNGCHASIDLRCVAVAATSRRRVNSMTAMRDEWQTNGWDVVNVVSFRRTRLTFYSCVWSAVTDNNDVIEIKKDCNKASAETVDKSQLQFIDGFYLIDRITVQRQFADVNVDYACSNARVISIINR